MKNIIFICLAAWMLSSCSIFRKEDGTADKELKMLVDYMTGDFSSEAQSKKDSAYFDIRLHIRRIWANDQGKYWLYVEQAVASAQDKPYRQRVYLVQRDDAGDFKSIVYTLPDASKWAGAYKNVSVFDQLKPADLSLREGCSVFLYKNGDGSFSGSTRGEGCESNLRNAKYATSKVTITARQLNSWDQGFNEKGEQVWGAVKGGYEFIKQ